MTSSSGSLVRLRAGNTRAVTTLLAAEGPLSRADLARRTGLSRATVSSLVSELLDRGLVAEAAERGRPLNGRSGRPPVLVRLSVPHGGVAGVDLGHEHVRVAVADRTGTVLAEEKVDLDVDGHAEAALDTAAAMVARGLLAAGLDPGDLRSVGMCVPAPLDRRSARAGGAVMPTWEHLTPAVELGSRLGAPVHAENDANLGALGEMGHGAARGVADLVHVKVASGLGAGLVLGGRLYRGRHGLAGEIGHVQVVPDPDGVPDTRDVCRCGWRGCLETVVTVPRVIASLRGAHGDLDAAALLALERSGVTDVVDALGRAGRVLGGPVRDLVTNLNPECVVVGGALGGSPAFLAGVRASLARLGRADSPTPVDVRAGALGERAEVLGAVSLALAEVAAA